MSTVFPENWELATVRTGDRAVEFNLTPEDVLWTARAAAREAAREVPITTWAFTQRAVQFMLANPKWSYASVLRAFSQPINPIWARDGKMCRPGGKYHGTSYCTEAKFRAREWYTNATWDQIGDRHPGVLPTVALWAKGKLPNPIPRVSNFAAPKEAKKYLERNPGSKLYYKGDNWYIVDPATANWPDSYVQMAAVDGSVASAAPIRPKTIFAAIMKGVTEWWRVG